MFNCTAQFHNIHKYLKCNVNAAVVQRVFCDQVITLHIGH